MFGHTSHATLPMLYILNQKREGEKGCANLALYIHSIHSLYFAPLGSFIVRLHAAADWQHYHREAKNVELNFCWQSWFFVSSFTFMYVSVLFASFIMLWFLFTYCLAFYGSDCCLWRHGYCHMSISVFYECVLTKPPGKWSLCIFGSRLKREALCCFRATLCSSITNSEKYKMLLISECAYVSSYSSSTLMPDNFFFFS